jgi:hypothetical protein
MNDSLMVGIVLTLVFGAVIFYLYNRLSMTERKMGLFEGVLTDLKIMMDSAPYVSGPPSEGNRSSMSEFEPTPEYLNAISGPFPLKEEEVEEVQDEQAMGQPMGQQMENPVKSLQIDELAGVPLTATNAINVTKLSPDLESMSLKELQQLAKEKGLTVAAGARRKALIDLLKVNGSSDTSSVQGTVLSSMDGPELVGGAPLDSLSS